jgi:PTH1 family peptidyl-tRNA hydrolase
MKLIVGLGNPGKEYDLTRHNMGFFMIDNYLASKKITGWKEKFQGLYIKTNIDGNEVIFLKPQKFMNLSGEVVKSYVDFFKIATADILVIADDLDLKVGNIKVKEKGSCGGHNGLRDIEKNIGTSEYKRLKIGIANDKSIDTKDYVLDKINSADMEIYKELSLKVNKIIDDFFKLNFMELMNKYNQKNK